MGRLIIFSDLHANWEALLALQQAEPHPEAVLCLGDIVGYGPDPKLCLDAVHSLTASRETRFLQETGFLHGYSIAGSADRAVGLKTPPSPIPDTQCPTPNTQVRPVVLPVGGCLAGLEESWAHARSILPANDRDYLAGLPAALTVELAGVRFHLTRLPPDNSETETQMLITMPQARLRELFGAIKAEVILLGGPHIPALRQLDGRLIVCPGSLGQPLYGTPDPTFAAWEDGRLQIHHLHYHPQATIRKLSLLPLAPEHTLALQAVLQTGGRET
jgi:predicted phosphodiesterase